MNEEFNPELGQALANEAIQRVGENANAAWMAAAFSAVERVARSQPRFTTDDAKRVMEPGYHTHEPRAWGAVMTRAANELLCRAEPVHWKSQRSVSHSRPQRVWHSLVYWRTIAGKRK